MRSSTPRLTPELTQHCGKSPVWRAAPYPVSAFRELVKHVARLSYLNADDLLFFRGQDKDYQSKSGGTTLYPAIYRGDALPSRELEHRFSLLDYSARLLVEAFKGAKVDGHRELRHKRYMQWSILQHYEVVPTPLLDITHSIRVACSFAQLRSTDPTCYVYVLGLPYITHRITVNSEHDIVNIRLLSICPPAALRPYFQEGYLAGTTDVTTEFDRKTDLDFRNRLIAKFAIPRAKSSFWGSGFDQIPEAFLFPEGDEIEKLCSDLKPQIRTEQHPGDLGTFIQEWSTVEDFLLTTARRLTERNVSVREAIRALYTRKLIDEQDAKRLEVLLHYRNLLVHKPADVGELDLRSYIHQLKLLRQHLTKYAV